ncbi:MAG: histidine kinase [Candidatus Azobacteroides sp.]|nr:histidine kinase [Candidatus Azobacteroides sp.]
MNNKQQLSFFYDFLISPRYRVVRHLLLIVTLFIISANQTRTIFTAYKIIDYKVVFVLTANMLAFLLTIYINLYVLIPRYLFTGKYFNYAGGFVLSVVFLIGLINLIEYGTYKLLHVPESEWGIFVSWHSLLLEFIFNFSLLLICISGGAATSLLRQWLIENQHISRLKNNYLKSEIEELKERISPEFLFNSLHKAGEISASQDPESASSILVKLSKILRYQLYDCSRETAFLHSEIAFLENFLNLYQLLQPDFEYRIQIEGNVKNTFVHPLIFLPLVQLLIERNKEKIKLDIRFVVQRNTISFTASLQGEKLREDIEIADLQDIHRRMKFLYKNSYYLSATQKKIELQVTHKEYDN